MKKYLIIALLGTALSAADTSAAGSAEVKNLKDTTTRVCKQLIALSAEDVDFALANFERIGLQLTPEIRAKVSAFTASTDAEYEAQAKALRAQIKASLPIVIDRITGATGGAKALVQGAFDLLFLMNSEGTGEAIKQGIAAAALAPDEGLRALYQLQRFLDVHNKLQDEFNTEETEVEFATRVLTRFPDLKPADYKNDHHNALFSTPCKGMSTLTAERAKLQAGIDALALRTLPSAVIITAAAGDDASLRKAPVLATAGHGLPPAAVVVPTATHDVSDAPLPTAAVVATVVEETDADFAKRVLAKFPALKHEEFAGAHYAAIFNTACKGVSILKTTRAKFEAGLEALAAPSVVVVAGAGDDASLRKAPVLATAGHGLPPAAVVVPTATHDVSDAHLATAAVVATAVEETDADFAKRVLAKFPALKHEEFAGAHYAAIFGTACKGMSKLIAARTRFQAGLGSK